MLIQQVIGAISTHKGTVDDLETAQPLHVKSERKQWDFKPVQGNWAMSCSQFLLHTICVPLGHSPSTGVPSSETTNWHKRQKIETSPHRQGYLGKVKFAMQCVALDTASRRLFFVKEPAQNWEGMLKAPGIPRFELFRTSRKPLGHANM